jgi:hypothetical protein
MNRIHFCKLVATGAAWVAAAAVCLIIPLTAEARDVRNNTRTNVNRNVNVNRDVNVNRNVNVNTRRHVDIDVDVDRHHHHPIATAAAVGATMAVTSAVIGSMVYTLPPACSTVIVNGIAYSQCGSVWYQPQYVGSTVQYVVINPPR